MVRRPGPLSAATATLIYLSAFLLCLIGAGGVVVVVCGLVIVDLVLGGVRGDLKERLRRPRW